MNLAQIEALKSKLMQYRRHITDDYINNQYNESEQDYKTRIGHIQHEIYLMVIAAKQIHKEAKGVNINKTEARNFTKAFKHEFLTQMKDYNSSLSTLIATTLECLPENPGINIENYVLYLYLNGYFTFSSATVTTDDLKSKFVYELQYEHLNCEECTVQVTDKALRYLENEANVSLRRAK